MLKKLKQLLNRSNKPQPGDLLFDSPHTAFTHACKYLDSQVSEKHPVLAYVLESRKDGRYPIKVANNESPGIPRETVDDLLHFGNAAFICPTAESKPELGKLRRGDLVLFQPSPDAIKRDEPYSHGFITDKVQPVFRAKEKRWLSAI